MKKISKKKIVSYLILFILCNQLTHSIVSPCGFSYYCAKSADKTKSHKESKISFAWMKRETIEDYLQISQLLVAAKTNGIDADCKYFSNHVFDLFSYLVQTEGKEEYLNKLRIAATTEGLVGHVWVQYKCGDQWKNFEATNGSYDVSHKAEFVTFTGTKVFYPLPKSFLKPGGTLEDLISYL